MSKLYFGYDADGAGQTAIMRGMDILRNMGIDIRVLQIEGAKDPDEYVIKYGPEKFKKCMDNAISIVEYKVKNLRKNLNIENTSDKIKFLNEIAKILSEVDNTVEREIYIDKITKTYNISKNSLEAEINKKLYKSKVSEKVLEKTGIKTNTKVEQKVDKTTQKRERMLIYLLINNFDETYEKIKDAVSLDCIKIDRNKQILNKIFEKTEQNADIENVIDWFSDEETVNYISGILAEDFEIKDVQKAIEDIEKVFLKEKKIVRRDEIINKLNNRDNLDSTQIAELEEELNKTIIEIANVK